MELETKYQVTIKDQIELDGMVVPFQDAMYFEIGHKPNTTILEQLAQERIDNWVESVKNAPDRPPIDETPIIETEV